MTLVPARLTAKNIKGILIYTLTFTGGWFEFEGISSPNLNFKEELAAWPIY